MKTTFLIIELTIALAFVLAFTPLGSWLRKVSHKSLLRNFCILCVCGLFCGCSSTTTTETIYNTDGTVASTTVTKSSESPVVILAGNTKDKHILFHQGGFYGNIGVQPNTNSYGIGGGVIDNTYASIVPSNNPNDGANVAKQFAKILTAGKYDLSITKDGVNSENETVSATKNTETKGE